MSPQYIWKRDTIQLDFFKKTTLAVVLRMVWTATDRKIRRLFEGEKMMAWKGFSVTISGTWLSLDICEVELAENADGSDVEVRRTGRGKLQGLWLEQVTIWS